ncbi:MAG: UDP-glucose/GDP-mannose dehydrogenase family protein [Candidatus Dormiibacterota bacterium]
MSDSLEVGNDVYPSPDHEPIAIVGAGYVGLVTGACLAVTGRRLTLVEVDPQKRDLIARGEAPIYEPGLAALLARAIEHHDLSVVGDLATALRYAKLVVVAVGTPSQPDGRADLSALDSVISTIGAEARPGTVVVIKSTVPPGTGRRFQRALGRGERGVQVVSCPEFLREGCAVQDITQSDRFVVGGSDEAAVSRTVAALNAFDAPVLRTGNTEAELIKYGSNAFLAMKISFINEIANLCDLVEADIDDVAQGMGLDPRIGAASLRAGLGFGGSCFPKDVAALEHAARREGFTFWMLRAATEVNEQQRMRFVQKIRESVGSQLESRRVAVLGLAFKPGTDDLRQAPSLAIVTRLLELGASVVVHDPIAMTEAKKLLPSAQFAPDPYSALEGADVIALVTEWPEYRSLDWARAARLVNRRSVVDGRNFLDPADLALHGFNYYGIGRLRRTTQWDRRKTDRSAAHAVAATVGIPEIGDAPVASTGLLDPLAGAASL